MSQTGQVWDDLIDARDALAQLDEDERKVVMLSAMGYLQREISERRGVTQQAISKQLKKVRAKLGCVVV